MHYSLKVLRYFNDPVGLHAVLLGLWEWNAGILSLKVFVWEEDVF